MRAPCRAPRVSFSSACALLHGRPLQRLAAGSGHHLRAGLRPGSDRARGRDRHLRGDVVRSRADRRGSSTEYQMRVETLLKGELRWRHRGGARPRRRDAHRRRPALERPAQLPARRARRAPLPGAAQRRDLGNRARDHGRLSRPRASRGRSAGAAASAARHGASTAAAASAPTASRSSATARASSTGSPIASPAALAPPTTWCRSTRAALAPRFTQFRDEDDRLPDALVRLRQRPHRGVALGERGPVPAIPTRASAAVQAGLAAWSNLTQTDHRARLRRVRPHRRRLRRRRWRQHRAVRRSPPRDRGRVRLLQGRRARHRRAVLRRPRCSATRTRTGTRSAKAWSS